MSVVLDASAVLVLLLNEPGAEVVAELLDDGVPSTVDLAEVLRSFGGSSARQRVPALDPRIVGPEQRDQPVANVAAIDRAGVDDGGDVDPVLGPIEQ